MEAINPALPSISIVDVAGFLLAVGAIGGVVAVLLRPWKQITHDVEDLKRRMDATEAETRECDVREKVEEHERKLQADYERQEKAARLQAAQARALVQLINHEIDGNHDAQLKEARDALADSIIEEL